MNFTSRIINFFSLDGTVKYWTPDGINNKQKITSYEMMEDNSFIKVKESGLYMIYSQVIKWPLFTETGKVGSGKEIQNPEFSYWA